MTGTDKISKARNWHIDGGDVVFDVTEKSSGKKYRVRVTQEHIEDDLGLPSSSSPQVRKKHAQAHEDDLLAIAQRKIAIGAVNGNEVVVKSGDHP